MRGQSGLAGHSTVRLIPADETIVVSSGANGNVSLFLDLLWRAMNASTVCVREKDCVTERASVA